MTSSADVEHGDGRQVDQHADGRPGTGGAPEVVDFDLLDAPAGAPAPEVVDFGALAGPDPADPGPTEQPGSKPPGSTASGPATPESVTAGVATHKPSDDVLAQPLTATSVEVAVLDESAQTSVPVAVVDVESVGRSPRRSRAGRADAGRPRADVPAAEAPVHDPSEQDPSEHGPAGGGRSGGGRRRSSFGDGGSSSFGGRSRGSGSRRGAGGRGARREWGIQLDAEVEEPTPPTAGGAAPEEASGPLAADERRPRAGGRGRAGSFGRPRRAEGEPAPEYEDPEQAARQICLTALTGASRTRQQLAELLASRDVPADAAESVLERFTEVGLIDDAAFAAAWVSSRQSGRGLSRRALADELRRKGVDKEVASVALEAVDPQDEWYAARALVARKVPGMRRLDTATATRRLTAMLGRKGYGAGLSAWVVREALEADGKAEDAAAEADDAAPDLEPASVGVRRGLWSGRPLDDGPAEVGEVGEGLSAEGRARTQRPGRLR